MIPWLKCDADNLRTHLGKRILLLGCPGSGKTTLGKQLSPILNIQLFQLDDYYWKEDGTCPEEDEWFETLCSFLMRESWIIEGNYLSAFEMRIKRADSVIVLAPTTRVCLWRVLKRGVTSLFSRDTSATPFRTARSYLFDLNPKLLFRILDFNRVERKLQFECLGRLGAKVMELKSNEPIDDLFYALRIQDEDRKEVVHE
jgi:energy-coupling factor transporter ATP-binding protein EcfA2